MHNSLSENHKTYKGFATASIVFGFIGLLASFELATEYVHKLKNPSYIPNCDVNPLVTCGPNMASWQGSLFGFSNTFIGLFAFMAPIFIGFALLAGARFANWFWSTYFIGLSLGFAFILWLSWQSVFSLGTLCPWCMVVWSVMTPLFWLSAGYIPKNLTNVPVKIQKFAHHLGSWAWVLILLTYVYIATIAEINLNWIQLILR